MQYKHLIAYLGQKKNQDLKDSGRDLISVTGYKNYTPEVIARLKSLYDQGVIDSYPKHLGGTIDWKDAKNQDHRDPALDLPSTEFSDGSRAWHVHGVETRENGPSWINQSPNACMLVWRRNGKDFADHDSLENTYKISVNGQDRSAQVSKETYANFIRKEFPGAGDKIFYEDWAQ